MLIRKKKITILIGKILKLFSFMRIAHVLDKEQETKIIAKIIINLITKRLNEDKYVIDLLLIVCANVEEWRKLLDKSQYDKLMREKCNEKGECKC